ncbi:enoyl CoA hydratase domain-containing protein 1 [Entophlyctis luteolus]|nr:enoyl CoA hydratase domain-containing protein 1 [Entophlyctis luteolus]
MSSSVSLRRIVRVGTGSKAKSYAHVQISNPHRSNSISPAMMEELGEVLDHVLEVAMSGSEPDLCALIIDGAPVRSGVDTRRTFCAGFDLSAAGSSSPLSPSKPSTPALDAASPAKSESSASSSLPDYSMQARKMSELMHRNMLKLHRLPLISIAAVDGHALGGGAELMAWADLRLMMPDARAGFVQTRMGVVTGWGGAARLRSLVGPANALRILTRPRVLDAHECLAAGIATHVAAPAAAPAANEAHRAQEHARSPACALDAAVRDILLADMADAYPAAVRAMKRVLAPSAASELEQTLAREREEFCALWGAPDNVEAVETSRHARRSNQNHHHRPPEAHTTKKKGDSHL